MNAAEAVEKEVKGPKLRLLTGGKGPPIDISNPNWLSSLNVGSVFSCRKKGQKENYALMLLQLMFKHDITYIISDGLNTNPYSSVDHREFSKIYELVEIIEHGGDSHLDNGEPNNGHDLRTVRPPGVEDDADAEGRQPRDDPA
jgi:hypothetical protein